MAQEPRRIRGIQTVRINEQGDLESVETAIPDGLGQTAAPVSWTGAWPDMSSFSDEEPTPIEEKKKSSMDILAKKVGLKKNPQKKIALAWPAFLHAFRKFWPNIQVIDDPADAALYDLIVFSGGEDIDPEFYGESNTMSCGINAKRDRREYAVFEAVMSRMRSKTKILGVCRGHQLLTALTGGSLYQDFGSTTNPSTGKNFQWHPSPHPLEFSRMYSAETSILCKFFKDQKVSSLHHQAVKNPSQQMRAICSYGGLVEGCEGDRIITTQFHPEFDWRPGNSADNFFKFLAEEW